MTAPSHDITGIMLVGGRSRRMGRDKAFLPLQGRPLFERSLALLTENFPRVLLIGDRPERFAGYRVEVLPDLYPGSALGGLYTGLCRAETDYVFVAPCDLPFPSDKLLRHLCSLRKGHDAVVPRGEEALEPLFAVYAKSALPVMKELLEQGNLRVYDLYPLLRTRFVEGDELSRLVTDPVALASLNTPEEFLALSGKLHD